MNRAERARLAEETDAIVAAGGYRHGDVAVDIDEAVAAARDATHIHLPDDPALDQAATDPTAGSGGPIVDSLNGRGRVAATTVQRAEDPVVEVTRETTLAAARRLAEASVEPVACLNFASARHPGGGYRSGASAQEESLARSSALVACLEEAPEFYEFHREQRHPVYSDRVICSPDVPVLRDDEGALLPEPYLASFITAAAPNAGALRDQGWSGDLAGILCRRAGRVLAAAAAHGHQRLVLGAWGCGVFQNDPRMVASAFATLLDQEFAGHFSLVTFAIYDPQPGSPTYQAFHDALART